MIQRSNPSADDDPLRAIAKEDPVTPEALIRAEKKRVAIATIDAPPILTPHSNDIAADADDVSAFALRSAIPEFFIAHLDVNTIPSVPAQESGDGEQVRRDHAHRRSASTVAPA